MTPLRKAALRHVATHQGHMVEPSDLAEALDAIDVLEERCRRLGLVDAAAREIVFDMYDNPYPPPHWVWTKLREALDVATVPRPADTEPAPPPSGVGLGT